MATRVSPSVHALTAIILGLILGFDSRSLAATRPNIIVILADDMGFSDIGCYGSEIATPNIDALAANGLRYTQFYNAARCCPTRASLLTGVYPHQAGVGHMVDSYAAARRAAFGTPAYSDHLSIRAHTIAELLRSVGYRTYMSGKWHVGYRANEWPVARGFDRSFALIGGAMSYYGFGPDHALPVGERQMPLMAIDDEPYTPPEEGFFSTDAFTDHAVEFVKEPRPDGQPYFLYMAYNAPHWPLHARPETIARHRGEYREGWDRIREKRYARLKELGIINARWPLSPRPLAVPAWEAVLPKRQDRWDEWMAVYAAQIEEMDSAIGRLMAAVRESGQEENTLVLFLSDNGGAAERPVKTIAGAALGSRDSYEGYAIDGAHVSSAPFRMTKKFIHEGGIATPLIVRWPAGIPSTRSGQLVQDLGHVIDIARTCAELGGVEWVSNKSIPMAGTSLTPTFRGEKVDRHAPLFWEHEGNRGVRDGDWKLVASFEQPWELYDLNADRTETNDLAAGKPEIVERLSAEYDRWAARTGVLQWTRLSGEDTPSKAAK